MSNGDAIISRSRFEGKRITFGSTDRIDRFSEIARGFMEEMFELQPGDYVISDESDVRDFTAMRSSDTTALWIEIRARYGVEESDVGSGRFVDIFAEINNPTQKHTMTPNNAVDRTPGTAPWRFAANLVAGAGHCERWGYPAQEGSVTGTDEMASKRFTNSAQTGLRGESFVEVLLSRWALPHRIVAPKDLGLDLLCEWVAGERPNGTLFGVQVKTTASKSIQTRPIGLAGARRSSRAEEQWRT